MASATVEKYRQFYMEYKNTLFSYLLYKSGDSEVASDIMQESFTRHFKHYGHQVVISPSLLFTIARNALVDYQRGVSRFYRTEIPPSQAATDEESSYLEKEAATRVDEAMAALPQQDMEILTLAVGGMAYREIAAIFDLSVATVKVRVHRARTKLRTLLEKEVR